jgi:hypothetical protein
MSTIGTSPVHAPLLVVPDFAHPGTIEGARTPAHSISLTPKAFLPETAALSKAFVGIAIGEEGGSKQSVVVISDGRSVVRSERSSYSVRTSEEQILGEILNKLEIYAQSRGHKVSLLPS